MEYLLPPLGGLQLGPTCFSLNDAPRHPVHGSQGPRRSMVNPASMTKLSASVPTLLSNDADWSVLAEFLASRSKVVRLGHLPPFLLGALFSGNVGSLPAPRGLWQAADGSILALFGRHDDARAALARHSIPLPITPVLERDVHRFGELTALSTNVSSTESTPSPSTTIGRGPSSAGLLVSDVMYPPSNLTRECSPLSIPNGMVGPMYTISSNPPNPKNSFRMGDWICSAPICGVHNFGRNAFCRGCGIAHTGNHGALDQFNGHHGVPSRPPMSPRFFGASSAFFPLAPGMAASPAHSKPAPSGPAPHGASPTSTLLTPSGSAFAVGGKVHNVSNDPLAPCVMFWPDNEPLPEQGQIRPLATAAIQHPPILNTGNRGPIEHQPGDWVCQKCNYLNWRRRKVCQTCFPYAEGNGDSVSASVQAERVALLTSVLQRQTLREAPVPLSPSYSSAPQPTARPVRARTLPLNPILTQRTFASPAAVHRARSQLDLGGQYTHGQPIYQTSGHMTTPSSPAFNMSSLQYALPAPTPSVFLPSFMNDLTDSPSLSPTSTSSADFSLEDFDDRFPSPPLGVRSRMYGGDLLKGANGSSPSLQGSNIWGLDGEERKALSGAASRKGSREMLRAPVM